MPIEAKTKGTFLKLFFFGALIAIGFGKKKYLSYNFFWGIPKFRDWIIISIELVIFSTIFFQKKFTDKTKLNIFDI